MIEGKDWQDQTLGSSDSWDMPLLFNVSSDLGNDEYFPHLEEYIQSPAILG